MVWFCLVGYLVFSNFFVETSHKKNKKIIYIILAAIGIVFVMGSRALDYPRINDVTVYVRYYELISGSTWQNIVSERFFGFEIGYVLFCKGLSYISKEPQTLFYAEAVVCVTCFSIFAYKNSKNLMDSFIIFVSFGLLGFMLSGIRQAIAMSICLLGVEFIKKKKFLPFALVVGIAFLFHQTALVFLPVYWIARRKITVTNFLVIGLIYFLILIFRNQIIDLANNLFHRNYSLNTYQGTGIGNFIVFAFVLMLYFMFEKDNTDYQIGYNLSVVALLLFILSFFTSEIIQRISLFFYFGTAIAIPNLYPRDKESKLIFRILLIAVALVSIAFRFMDSLYGDYHFFWQING